MPERCRRLLPPGYGPSRSLCCKTETHCNGAIGRRVHYSAKIDHFAWFHLVEAGRDGPFVDGAALVVEEADEHRRHGDRPARGRADGGGALHHHLAVAQGVDGFAVLELESDAI